MCKIFFLHKTCHLWPSKLKNRNLVTTFSLFSLISLEGLVMLKVSSLFSSLQKHPRAREYKLKKASLEWTFLFRVLSFSNGTYKGQLISKGLFDVIFSTKKPTKFFKVFLPQPLKRGRIKKQALYITNQGLFNNHDYIIKFFDLNSFQRLGQTSLKKFH